MPLHKLEHLFRAPASRKYRKGHIILHQGDELRNTYYIKRGYVKLYTITDDGDERILLIFQPRSAFPLLPNMSAPKFFINYYYEAMTDVELSMIPRRKLAKILDEDPEVAQLALNYIIELSADAVRRIGAIESKDAKNKLARLLQYLIKICGVEITQNKYRLKMKITHQDMANLAGLARETTSIQAKKLEQEGVINHKGSYMTINAALLPKEN